jgi:hypothetical protein
MHSREFKYLAAVEAGLFQVVHQGTQPDGEHRRLGWGPGDFGHQREIPLTGVMGFILAQKRFFRNVPAIGAKRFRGNLSLIALL